MNKIKKLLEDFNATLSHPFGPMQIGAHAEGLAGSDPDLLQRALHRAYDNAHEYFQGKPSVEQLRGIMGEINQADHQKRKDKEEADTRNQERIIRDAGSSNEHRDTASKCLSLFNQFTDDLITKDEFETRVKEATE